MKKLTHLLIVIAFFLCFIGGVVSKAMASDYLGDFCWDVSVH
jgi:hypothetical protein